MASKLLQPESKKSEVRIVLLGKTGVGKSASGNKILGSKSFESKLSSGSVTKKCKMMTREFNGQTLTIVDTPGLFHTFKNNQEVMKEILDFTMLITPGPHVFLLVLKLGTFRTEDKEMLECFKKVFQDAKKYTIVLFTHGDREREADTFIERKKILKKFISESCEEYHVFNNKAEDESQVISLLEKINNMVQKNEGHYSNEMFAEAERALEVVMQSDKVKSASDPKKAGISWLEDLICQGLAALLGKDSAIYEGVKSFLEKVTDVALKLMPLEAFSQE